MKKLITSFLAFSLSLSAFAQTAPTFQELSEKYNYALEVEWDQKDQAFLGQLQHEMTQDLQAMIDHGASPEDLLAEAMQSMPEGTLKNEVSLSLNRAAKHELSAEEFQSLMSASLKKQGTEGASWSPAGNVAVGVVGVIAVSYLALRVYFYFWGKKFGA